MFQGRQGVCHFCHSSPRLRGIRARALNRGGHAANEQTVTVPFMKQDIILGLVRHILTALGGILVTKGLADAAGLESAIGALVTLAGFVWSVVAKTKKTN
jgi:hypothetical protein